MLIKKSVDWLLYCKSLSELRSIRKLANLMPEMDSSFRILVHLEHLVSLDLSQCALSYGIGFKYLAKLEKLKHLNLSYCAMRKAALERLGCLSKLQSLNLGLWDHLAGDQWEFLQQFSILEYLNLFMCPNFTNPCFSYLFELEHLRGLNLRFTSISDQGLLNAPNLAHLETLDLSHTTITNSSLQKLAHLPALRTMMLDGCVAIDDSGLVSLSELHNLKFLSLAGLNQISGIRFADFAKSPLLQGLNLNCSSINDDGLRQIAKLVNLQYLSLGGCTFFTEAALCGLFASLRELRFLNLSSIPVVSDSSLMVLAELPHLQHLIVTGAGDKISETGLAVLCHLPHLDHLIIDARFGSNKVLTELQMQLPNLEIELQHDEIDDFDFDF